MGNLEKRKRTREGKGSRARDQRQYPPVYEKLIPVALVIIALAMVILLAVILGVALDLFPITR